MTITARVLSGLGSSSMPVRVTREGRMTITLNGVELIYLLCLPVDLDYLAVGFLYTEGIITSRQDIAEITVDETESQVSIRTNEPQDLAPRIFLKRTITSGCGKGIMFRNIADDARPHVDSSVCFSIAQIAQLWAALPGYDHLYRETRGVHSSALCSHEKIEFFSSDIGRHNTIDRLVGRCLLEGVTREDKLLLCSGRFSSEMVFKLGAARIPIAFSRCMPTGLAVQLADEMGITLGKIDGAGSLIVFSHPERILVQ